MSLITCGRCGSETTALSSLCLACECFLWNAEQGESNKGRQRPYSPFTRRR
jgi:hypothetical protein